MLQFEHLRPSSIRLTDIIGLGISKHNPGWNICEYICRLLSSNFVVFKSFLAILLNVSVFKFFKRESKAPFLCIFMYAISLYLILNFNVLRQACAVAFAMYGYSALTHNEYKRFALFSIGALLFHTSAFIILILPIFQYIKGKKYALYIFFLAFAGMAFIMYKMDMTSLIELFLNMDILNTAYTETGFAYMTSMDLGIRDTFNIISPRRIIIAILLYYSVKKNGGTIWNYCGLFYLFILIIQEFFPILHRFRIYFDFGYFIMLSNLIMGIFNNKLRKILIYMTIILMTYFQMRIYLSELDYGFKYINQYYPYHTIFDPQKEIRSHR